MKTELIPIGNGEVYMVSVPEVATEGELSKQDEIILMLHDKLSKFEEMYEVEEVLSESVVRGASSNWSKERSDGDSEIDDNCSYDFSQGMHKAKRLILKIDKPIYSEDSDCLHPSESMTETPSKLPVCGDCGEPVY